MAAVIAFIVGYVLGTRAGEEGFEELKDAWQTISSSAEVKDLLARRPLHRPRHRRSVARMLAERMPTPAIA